MAAAAAASGLGLGGLGGGGGGGILNEDIRVPDKMVGLSKSCDLLLFSKGILLLVSLSILKVWWCVINILIYLSLAIVFD